MVQTKEKRARTFVLALSALLLLLHAFGAEPCEVGIYEGAGWSRVLYPFFHASWMHVAMNVWCLLCIVFYYRVGIGAILVAYLLSVSFPVDTLASWGADLSAPTVGISGLCFALIGDCSHLSSDKRHFHSYMCFFLLLGFFLPNVNALLHLYCYVMGICFGYKSMEDGL